MSSRLKAVEIVRVKNSCRKAKETRVRMVKASSRSNRGAMAACSASTCAMSALAMRLLSISCLGGAVSSF